MVAAKVEGQAKVVFVEQARLARVQEDFNDGMSTTVEIGLLALSVELQGKHFVHFKWVNQLAEAGL